MHPSPYIENAIKNRNPMSDPFARSSRMMIEKKRQQLIRNITFRSDLSRPVIFLRQSGGAALLDPDTILTPRGSKLHK